MSDQTFTYVQEDEEASGFWTSSVSRNMPCTSSNKILNNVFIITHTLWIDSVTVSDFKHLHEVLYKILYKCSGAYL